MKRILAIILGVMLMITPFAGCKEESKTYTLTVNENDAVLSLKGQEEPVRKIVSIYGISLEPEREGVPNLLVVADSLLWLEELFELMPLQELALTETKKQNGEKIKVRIQPSPTQDIIIEFCVTTQGAIEYYDEETKKYYASTKNVADYENLLVFCSEHKYEYPYQTTSGEDVFALKDGDETLFSFTIEDLEKMTILQSSSVGYIVEEDRLLRTLNVLFGNVKLRETDRYPAWSLLEIQYGFFIEGSLLTNFNIIVRENGVVIVNFGDQGFISEMDDSRYEMLRVYFAEDYMYYWQNNA